jgi:IS30 family transposase
MFEQGHSRRFIARALKRAPSTISRELRRNRGTGVYDPYLANWYATERRRWCRPKYKRGHRALMRYVLAKLNAAWSPQQIAGRLRCVEQVNNPSMQISHETIYRHIRSDYRDGGQLYRSLRHGRRKYDKRLAPCPARGRIADRVSIDERPKSVDAQLHIGDWEADTVFGRKSTGYIATCVDRRSLYLVARLIPDLKASTFNRAVLDGFKRIPNDLCRTMTCDNGTEFSAFKDLERKLECRVYFAHPYHAWERAINENTNGLLRQFIPKKSDLRKWNQQKLSRIVQKLNRRPRRKLNYRTPSEVFAEASVALQR